MLAEHFHRRSRSSTASGSRHRWAGVIDTSTRFSASFGTAHGGRSAYALGFTGLGVGAVAVRGRRDARPARRGGHRADPAGDGAPAADAVSARAGRPGPASSSPGGRSPVPTTPGAATCGCARSTGSGSASTPSCRRVRPHRPSSTTCPASAGCCGPEHRARGRAARRGADRDTVASVRRCDLIPGLRLAEAAIQPDRVSTGSARVFSTATDRGRCGAIARSARAVRRTAAGSWSSPGSTRTRGSSRRTWLRGSTTSRARSGASARPTCSRREGASIYVGDHVHDVEGALAPARASRCSRAAAPARSCTMPALTSYSTTSGVPGLARPAPPGTPQ